MEFSPSCFWETGPWTEIWRVSGGLGQEKAGAEAGKSVLYREKSMHQGAGKGQGVGEAAQRPLELNAGELGRKRTTEETEKHTVV